VLAGSADPDLTRARKLLQPAYAKYEELFERESLDAVFICTPPNQHRSPAVAAFERGLAVYLEKPVARSLEDAEAIARAARGRVCAVGYQWRGIELLPLLRDELAGPPALISGRGNGLIIGGRGWFADPRLGGGILSEAASHIIDLEVMLGGAVTAVRALSTAAGLGAAPGAIDDVLALSLAFAGGGIGTVEIAWTLDQVPASYRLDVIAADLRLTLELEPTVRLVGYAHGHTLDLPAGTDHEERSLQTFLRAAREGDPAGICCTIEDGVQTLAVALACERTLGEGERPPLL
jgi:predicted dehydrogenase